MNDEELKAIEKRWKAMPDLPWEWEESTRTLWCGPEQCDYGEMGSVIERWRATLVEDNEWVGTEDQTVTLGHTRQDISMLVAEVQRLREEVKHWEDNCDGG